MSIRFLKTGGSSSSDRDVSNYISEACLTGAAYEFIAQVKKIDTVDLTGVTDISGAFTEMINLEEVKSIVNSSGIENTSNTFFKCAKLKSIPLFDTSNVNNMIAMFSGCTELPSVPLLDTSKVINMGSMFYKCSALAEIPAFNLAKATSLSSTFAYCSKIKTLPQFNMSSVTDMGSMCRDCTSLTDVPVLNTAKVTGMGSAFANCPLLSDDSLNNILQMCVNATSYSGTKRLKSIGLTEEQATKCTTLSNYEAFTAAGWTTGY